MTAAPRDELDTRRSWLVDHIGRLAGLLLGLVVVAFVVLLALAGYPPAISLLVVVVASVAIVAIGAQLRGGAGHS